MNINDNKFRAFVDLDASDNSFELENPNRGNEKDGKFANNKSIILDTIFIGLVNFNMPYTILYGKSA